MRKALKVMIAKAEEVIEIWGGNPPNCESPDAAFLAMKNAIKELKESIKKIKGEA